MSETAEQVISGLEGVLACESSITFIDGTIPELSFRGYRIEDIAQTLTFEQITHLLWYDRIPQGADLQAFRDDLAARRELPATLLDMLRQLPASAHPMAGLRTVVSMLGAMDDKADDISYEANIQKAKNLTAQLPTIVTAQARLQKGLEPIAPDPSLGHTANYYYMLTGEQPDGMTSRTFDTTLILYAEHETNASTFACRVVAGTESDYYSSVVAGIGAIKGPLHGGAPGPVLDMLDAVGDPGRAPGHRAELARAAREAGVETAVLNPLEGLTEEELDRGENYFTVMRSNLEALRAGLGCR